MPEQKAWKKCLRSHALTLLTVVGVVSGTLVGWCLKSSGQEWSRRQIMYFNYPGEIFLRMLKCLIVPLLTSSIISAIASLDLSLSKSIGKRAIIYYMMTTLAAVALGIVLVSTIRPGKVNTSALNQTLASIKRDAMTVDTLLDLTRNLFQENVVQATMFTYKTKLVHDPENPKSIKDHLETYKIEGGYSMGTNVLGLVSFSVVMGMCIGMMRDKGRILQDFFLALSEGMMIITGWVIWMSPVGVFFLVTSKIMEMESFAVLVSQLGLYFMTVMLGLFLHGFGTLTVLYFLLTRELPFKYISKMGQVLATAFGTASSSATMPLTIKYCEDRGVDSRIARFVVPIGATINMDGTALYEAVAAIFIAQLRNVDLTLGKIVAISLTATAASIGAAGIPQAGLVTMVMVLDTVGLPPEDVSIILAVDWLLDRFRTTINVMCDALGTLIVAHLSRNDFRPNSEPPANIEENDATC